MAIQATADQGFIRKHNTAVVLDGLRRFAPLSRVELAARTGLNRSTVSLIINKLIKEGFIQEAYLQSPKIGRPGMLLVLNPKGGFTVGIEMGQGRLIFAPKLHWNDVPFRSMAIMVMLGKLAICPLIRKVLFAAAASAVAGKPSLAREQWNTGYAVPRQMSTMKSKS